MTRFAAGPIVGGVLALAGLSPLSLCTTTGSADTSSVDIICNVKIPLRDGTRLNATVYRPHIMDHPLPVVCTSTPYISDSYHQRALYFSQNGFVYVLVDVRGRGNSEGTFAPFAQEPRDGHDVVEWLALQPWSNGKVAPWGGSYAGYNQWATAKEFPPHLITIVPAAAAHPGVDFPFFKNIWYPYVMQWLTYTSGVTPQGNLYSDDSFWIKKFTTLFQSRRPFKDLDSISGNLSTVFRTWLAHPIPDPYWDAMVPSVKEYAQLSIPILTITGHYDADQAGAMEYYRNHMRHGSSAGRARHFLIVGPWDHAGTRSPKKEVKGLVFGDASVVDMNKLHKEWYEWTMKEGKKPDFLKKNIAYYVVGEEKWKYADSLGGIARGGETLYFNSLGGGAHDAFHSGMLSDVAPVTSKPDTFVYDPLDMRPAEIEQEEVKNTITDERYALNLYGNGVVYHSDPFKENTEITGYVKCVVWMSMNVVDTDFGVSLYEITLDGTSVLLTGDQLRARYRESLRKEELIRPGAINRYEFDGFTFFSRRIAKGSRLRLVLGCLNSIYTQKNYNSGQAVAEECGKDARAARVTVHHDALHPSFLELPLAK